MALLEATVVVVVVVDFVLIVVLCYCWGCDNFPLGGVGLSESYFPLTKKMG